MNQQSRPERPEATPIFLDFEASSLASSSYPIEVAWSLEDGTREGYLISPAGIDHWTDWSRQAEALHGISQEMLLREGKSPSWICERMNTQLDGKQVYVEDPTFDGMWLAALFSVSWKQPAFELKNLDELLRAVLSPTGSSSSIRKIDELKDAARRQCIARHRARPDVEYLITLWRLSLAAGGYNQNATL